MSDIAIRVENLSKLYRIGRAQQHHDTLRDAIADVRRKMEDGLRRHRNLPSSFCDLPSETDLWALRDVSFEVQRGEVVGIIGRNGAGKSTLLKILSRITEPTAGRAEIHGRVASLLEVGTGFHPELTGRENIYLNGAILGMKRTEIDRKFDEIVAFAEIEKFLDTPVKRYSSGMYVRLAFAVAAHLEPEILLVDEVLAVGDAAFQKKCLGKMEDVAKEGQTVLFVSHNMVAVQNLCHRAILLNNGRVEQDGNAAMVIASYLSRAIITHQAKGDVVASGLDGALELLAIDIIDNSAKHSGVVQCGQDILISLMLRSASEVRGVTFLVALNDHFSTRISVLNSTTAGYYFDVPKGIYTIYCRVPHLPLSPGTYEIEVKVLSGTEHLLWAPCAGELIVEMGDFYGSGRFPDPKWGGICHLQQLWETTGFRPSEKPNQPCGAAKMEIDGRSWE